MNSIMEQLLSTEMMNIYEVVWTHLQSIAGMLFKTKITVLDNVTTGRVELSLALIGLIVLGYFLKGRIRYLAIRLLYAKVFFSVIMAGARYIIN